VRHSILGNFICSKVAFLAATTLSTAFPAIAAENILSLDASGFDSPLSVIQTTDGNNYASISITGDRNGGASGQSWYGYGETPSELRPTGLLQSALLPGNIIQEGLSHSLQITVIGDDNLFAATQTGTGQSLELFIQGTRNQTAVIQSGAANVAVISQIGDRNSVYLRQSSW